MIQAAVLVPAPDYSEPHLWAYEIEAAALERGGFAVTARPWTEPGDLGGFDVILPLVAWGYQTAPDRWFALIDRLEAGPVPVVNPPALLRWNSDKAYLAELGRQAVATVPTTVARELDEAALESAHDRYGEQLVIKPPISASAYGTHRIARGDRIPGEARGRRMLVQPFLASVVEEGEYSLMFFGGAFSHAIIKRAKVGDYRVQPHLGGTELPCAPPEGAVDVALAALAATPAAPLYARVDLIRLDSGDLAVIELELIEPSLWLNHAPDAGASFAAAIREHLGH